MDYLKIDNIYTKLLKIQNILNENLAIIAKMYGFNSTELMIFLDIKTHPNTDLNTLCDRLGLKKSAASKALNKLILDKIIVKDVDPIDHRKVSLRHVELPDQNVCKEETLLTTFKGITEHECSLDKINESLDDLIKILK
ncbi:MarR family transcriptional regulator [Acholeplasma hippikon]|uniref:MarR family n=1 Tax=Acholeplasma hippikon TaxID=264636 RepID=A0A449BI17_9MOLU|nr:helix-turn-helix domain-containing protein [Acholeplasma hippikon]VEU82099.1 Uncharacterised protein [Acholeplasma hippikon]